VLTESEIRVGGVYPFLLAPGLISSATVIGERKLGKMRYVRYRLVGATLNGYCRASIFAKAVRAAQRER
jgi:hypothetical protein